MAINLRRLLWTTLSCAALLVPSLASASNTMYRYEYHQDAYHCGVSGLCSFDVFHQGSEVPVYEGMTWKPPVLYTKKGPKQLNAPYESNEKLKFILFEMSKNCKGPNSSCSVEPIIFKPNQY